jgi:hypothetical protein
VIALREADDGNQGDQEEQSWLLHSGKSLPCIVKQKCDSSQTAVKSQ